MRYSLLQHVLAVEMPLVYLTFVIKALISTFSFTVATFFCLFLLAVPSRMTCHATNATFTGEWALGLFLRAFVFIMSCLTAVEATCRACRFWALSSKVSRFTATDQNLGTPYIFWVKSTLHAAIMVVNTIGQLLRLIICTNGVTSVPVIDHTCDVAIIPSIPVICGLL